VPTERRAYSDTLKDEIISRHAAGETLPGLARKMGMPYATVKFICSSRHEAKRARRLARELAQVQEKTGRLF
jgi:hypothetical protein